MGERVSIFASEILKKSKSQNNLEVSSILKSIFSQPTHFNPKISSCYLANKHFVSLFQEFRLILFS